MDVAFTLIDLLAGTLWVLPIAALGFLAGGATSVLATGVRRYEEAAALFLVVALGALLGWRHVRRVVRWRELDGPTSTLWRRS